MAPGPVSGNTRAMSLHICNSSGLTPHHPEMITQGPQPYGGGAGFLCVRG